MSYILDALQRADAERGRGNVPGLHARQLPTALEEAATARTGLPRPLVWGGLLVLALATTVAGLWMWRSPASPSSPVAAAPATANQPAPATTPVASPPVPAAVPVVPVVPAVPVAPVVSPAAPTAPIATPPAALAPSAAASVGAPPAHPATVQAAAVARTAPQPAPTAPSAASDTPVTPAVAPVSATPAPRATTAPASTGPAGGSAAPAEAPLLSGLPEDLRRQIPALVITGVVHADNPAQRLLVVNNQVLTQDGQLGPDLVLETIGSRHSVFRFRGTRFRVANQ